MHAYSSLLAVTIGSPLKSIGHLLIAGECQAHTPPRFLKIKIKINLESQDVLQTQLSFIGESRADGISKYLPIIMLFQQYAVIFPCNDNSQCLNWSQGARVKRVLPQVIQFCYSYFMNGNRDYDTLSANRARDPPCVCLFMSQRGTARWRRERHPNLLPYYTHK